MRHQQADRSNGNGGVTWWWGEFSVPSGVVRPGGFGASWLVLLKRFAGVVAQPVAVRLLVSAYLLRPDAHLGGHGGL
jgi:hypothetical protein